MGGLPRAEQREGLKKPMGWLCSASARQRPLEFTDQFQRAAPPYNEWFYGVGGALVMELPCSEKCSFSEVTPIGSEHAEWGDI